ASWEELHGQWPPSSSNCEKRCRSDTSRRRAFTRVRRWKLTSRPLKGMSPQQATNLLKAMAASRRRYGPRPAAANAATLVIRRSLDLEQSYEHACDDLSIR